MPEKNTPFFLPGRKLGEGDPQSFGKYRKSCIIRASEDFTTWVRAQAKQQTEATGERVTVTDVTQQLFFMLQGGE